MAITRPDNPRFPHHCTITRAVAEDPMVDESETTIIYEGECRAYDKNTTSDKGEVLNSFRGLALPVDREGWIALGVVPREGDEVTVDRGTHKEIGRVVDVNPANFRGTHLVWKYGRS
jgi:hypothetical protein